MKANQYYIVLICLSLVFSGCFRTEFVKPESILSDNSKNLTVLTTDSTTYEFDAENYNIIQDGDSTFIQGKGRRLLEPRILGFMNFEGKIELRNVLEIQIVEKTFLASFFEYFFLISGAIVFTFLLLIWLTLGRVHHM